MSARLARVIRRILRGGHRPGHRVPTRAATASMASKSSGCRGSVSAARLRRVAPHWTQRCTTTQVRFASVSTPTGSMSPAHALALSPGMQSTCLLHRHLGQWLRKPPRSNGNTCAPHCSQANPWLVPPMKLALRVIAHPLVTSVLVARGGGRFALPFRVPGWQGQRPIRRTPSAAATFGSCFPPASQPEFRTGAGIVHFTRPLPNGNSCGRRWSPIGVVPCAPASASSPTGAMTDASTPCTVLLSGSRVDSTTERVGAVLDCLSEMPP